MARQLTGQSSDFLRVVLPACISGRLADVKKFAKDSRDFVKCIGPHGRTMLWEAARKGRLKVVEYLAKKKDADVHAIGCYFRETRVEVSPWLVATLNKHQKTVDYLESQGAGVDFNSAYYLNDDARTTRVPIASSAATHSARTLRHSSSRPN